MAKFNYDDLVIVKVPGVSGETHRQRAWVVAVIEDRERFPLAQFPPGVIYSVELEDGSTIDVHEDDLLASPS